MTQTQLIELLLEKENSSFGQTLYTTSNVVNLLKQLDEVKPQEQTTDLEKIDLLKNCKVDIAIALKNSICNIDATDIVDYSDVSFGITNGNEIEVEGLNIDEEELFEKIIGYLDETIDESINSIKDEM